MTATSATPASESVRKAAAAAYEALPAVLLAAALLAPAIAAFAARNAVPVDLDRKALEVRTGQSIADQGNEALTRIRQESREALRQNIVLPKLS